MNPILIKSIFALLFICLSNLNANLRRFKKFLFAVNFSRALEFAICKAIEICICALLIIV